MNLTIRQNVTNMALSQYTNFFFDRGIVEIAGQVIALNCQNLCKLGGNKDNAEDIYSRFLTGALKFTAGQKRVRSLHVSGQFGSKTAISTSYAMDSVSPDMTGVHALPSVVGSTGRGSLKFHGTREKHGEYLCVKVQNNSGAKFFIDSIDAVLVTGQRR